MLTSVSTGTNADLIAAVADFYIDDGAVVADVTFGRGTFWRNINIKRFDFKPSDLKGDPSVDFRKLPYDDWSIDVVILDPPYIHNPGKNLQIGERYRNETTKGLYHDDIIDLYIAGMREAKRVLKSNGLLWVKCKDEIEGGRQRWSHITIWQQAKDLGFYAKDLLILVPDSKTSSNRWQRQLHARKVHSYLWVFSLENPPRGVQPRRYED
jgi:hypothetical protein